VGILDAIGHAFSSGWRTLTGAAQTVFNGIKSVYNFIVTVIDHVGQAWVEVYNGIGALGAAAVDFMQHAAATLGHIVTVSIPDFVGKAGNAAAHGVDHLISVAIDGAKSVITDAWRAAIKVVNGVIDGVKAEVKSIVGTVTEVYNWFVGTARAAVALLENPGTLVAWIGNAIVVPVVQGLVSGGEAVASVLWKWLLANARSIFEEIEKMIADII
jgi:phage-related protein